jgi:hypothetical protein
MGKYGTNLEGFGAYEGGVNADKGAPLVSTSSDGETALLFGPAALREIQAGVANGDFAIPPDAAGDTITEENPLPYWTFTDVNSAGAITAAIVADAGAGSGNVLRFTVASGTLTGKSATLTRYIPVASSASRSFSFYAEATFESGTNSTQATAKLPCEFYKSDQVTVTGLSLDSDTYTFSQLMGATGITAPDLWGVAPDLTTMTAPADAGYLKITITIATVATQSAARTVDLTEVRVTNGVPELVLTDKEGSSVYPPAILNANNGELNVQSGGGDYLYLSPTTTMTGSTSINLLSGGAIQLQAGTTLDILAPSGATISSGVGVLGTLNVGAIATTGDMSVNAGGGDLIIRDTTASAPRLLFRTSDGSYQGGIRMGAGNNIAMLNGTSTTDYAYVLAERFYPMDGTTGSRYIFDNGTQTAFSGAVLAGAITSTGSVAANNYSADSITGTTATTNAAIWVLTAGTTYSLRRNTSSARYKTNIVDADAAVLEAARKIKPRHYESTIADEAGETRLGFIAEEVLAAGLSHAVGYNAEGQVETIDATALIAALYARVNDLEERLAALESR